MHWLDPLHEKHVQHLVIVSWWSPRSYGIAIVFSMVRIGFMCSSITLWMADFVIFSSMVACWWTDTHPPGEWIYIRGQAQSISRFHPIFQQPDMTKEFSKAPWVYALCVIMIVLSVSLRQSSYFLLPHDVPTQLSNAQFTDGVLFTAVMGQNLILTLCKS